MSTRSTIAGPLALLAAPIVVIASALIYPTLSGDAVTQVASLTSHRGAMMTGMTLNMVALVLLIGGLVWLAITLAPRAPRLAVAVAAGKSQTREGARYRRLSRRRGKAKALVALGNTHLKVYHKLLSSLGTRYTDLGPDYYERQASTRRQIAHHVGKLGALGFEVTLCRLPEPDPDPRQAASTQAA